MEQLLHCSEMAAKVALCPLWYTFATLRFHISRRSFSLLSSTYPCDEDILRQASVGILDLDKSELNPAVREFVNEIRKLTLYNR